MAAVDNNKDNMNDGNRDESPKSKDNNDGLLAVGRHAQNRSEDDSDLKENFARTAHRNELSQQSTEESELCSCSFEGQATFTPNTGPEMVCRLCGKAITRNGIQQGKFNRSHVNPTSTEEALLSVVPQSYSGHLPSLSSVSLEDDVRSMSTQAASSTTTVPSEPQRDKILVINLCHHSVQHPSPGLTVVLFLFERTHQERKEKMFTLYMIPKKEWQVYNTIRQSYIHEDTRQGYSTRQISFCVNDERSQDFHTVFVREQIRISFQIEDHHRETFVTPVDARGRDFVFRVANIECESSNRIAPGAKSHFRVQYVGDSEDPCQQQGKITLAIDAETRCSLYFSIAFWSLEAASD